MKAYDALDIAIYKALYSTAEYCYELLSSDSAVEFGGGHMPTIEVDFDSFKEITARRRTESMTEADVVREALGLAQPSTGTQGAVWHSEGVAFVVGTKLRHVFRGGKTLTAEIGQDGVLSNGQCFKGLSPAAASGAGHQANGWHFWEVQLPDGRWVKADSLRRR